MSDFRYYVYAYIRSKNSNTAIAGTPYYIGKGTGKRAYGKHIRGCINFTPSDKKNIIILENNLSLVGALALERRLIKWYGRKDLASGILINQTDGGDGNTGSQIKQHLPVCIKCEGCNIYFETRCHIDKQTIKNRFCSKQCANAVNNMARTKQKVAYTHQCVTCSKIFTTLTKNQKTCSRSCAAKSQIPYKRSTDTTLYTFKHTITNDIFCETIDAFIKRTGIVRTKANHLKSMKFRYIDDWTIYDPNISMFRNEIPNKIKTVTVRKISCIHCRQESIISNFNRWHGKNCSIVDPIGHTMRSKQITELKSNRV